MIRPIRISKFGYSVDGENNNFLIIFNYKMYCVAIVLLLYVDDILAVCIC